MTAQPFKTTMDYNILKHAYEWMVDEDGYLWGLTAGDHGYEKTNFRLTATQETMELGEKNVEEEYEPYMGWCDVKGCNNEAAANGSYYKDTGYWCLCSDHSYAARSGSPQPKMKQSAVDRENSRDKKTGYLPIPPTEEQ